MPPPKKARRPEQQQIKKMSTAAARARDAATSATTGTPQLHSLPLEVQQVILNVFDIAFPIAQDIGNLNRVIQEVKGYLFNRDFSSAFSQPSYLQAYALRWSAARALSYSHILTHPDRAFLLTTSSAASVNNQLGSQENDTTTGTQSQLASDQSSVTRVVCLGGGAGAEIVALTVAHRQLNIQFPLHITAVDSADWSDPVAKLSSAVSTAPTLSAHASDVAKAKIENQPLLEDSSKVTISFIHQDVLAWDLESLKHAVGPAILCSIMFTLNELFSASLPKTTSFLLNLTSSMCEGSHLLVVDSPGSYSEIRLGGASKLEGNGGTQQAVTTKKYPMKWLLDHTLLEVAGSGDDVKWEKIESKDSEWFRIDPRERDRLRYPVELENMRYQLHLYRRV